ncbi:MAG: sulfotransferase [Mycobacteriales bacterium]
MTWPLATEPALHADQVEPARVVLVLGADADETEAVARRLGRVSPVRDLTATIGPLLVGWDLGTAELGPPALVSPQRWLRAVRTLLLGLLGADGSRRVVAAEAGRPWVVMYLRRLFPDAVVVLVPGDSEEWAARLPELERAEDLRVTPDLVAQVDARCPPGRRPRSRPRPRRAGRAGRRLVVVLGSGRSGTTWLHTMLCASPDVAGTALGETSVFQSLEPVWRAHPRALALMRAFAEDVLVDALAPDGRRLVCEKTPAHAHLVPLIRALFPEAAFLHIVRDGRDVAMSLYAIEGAFPDLPAAARAWADAVTTVERDLAGAARHRTVRYEDLLVRAEQVVPGLWRWLGATPDPEALAARVRPQVSPLPSALTPGSGRWAGLPPAELAALEQACGRTLRRWGYT